MGRVTDAVDASAGDNRIVTAADRTVADLIIAGRDREAARFGLATESPEPKGARVDPLTQLGMLGPVLGVVVARITPEDLDRPTPCAHFAVRDVLAHMITGAANFAAAFRDAPAGEPDTTDPLEAFGPALEGLVAAMTAPGALDRTVASPFGEVPGETFARFVVLDGLVHAWDLATATGQPCDPPAELVAAVDAFARQTLDPLRDGETFADAVEPAPDASPIERLVAYTGRRPLAARAG